MDFADVRTLKDFLLLYNRISEDCFKKCVFDMSQRTLEEEESHCVSTCVQKQVNFNQKTMAVFADFNPGFQERKQKEREEEYKKMAEEAKRLEEQGPPEPSILEKVLGYLTSGGQRQQANVNVVSGPVPVPGQEGQGQ